MPVLWAETFVLQDATEPFTVIASRADARGAVVLDPANCVFARACKRQAHRQALFFRNVAYVRKNRMLVEKYQVPPAAKSVILSFDVSGIAPYGVPITLTPPSGQLRVGGRSGGKRGGTGQKRTKAVVRRARTARDVLRDYERHL